MFRLLFRFSTQIGHQQNNLKRFYKEASFKLNQNKKHINHNYLITLDGKTIKTPYRNVLAVPTQQLAFLIANEFNRQQKYLKTAQMPILALSRTAVDADIEGHLSEHLKHSIYQYLKTDTLLFYDQSFQKEHLLYCQPLIDNFVWKFDVKVVPSKSIETPHVQLSKNFREWVDGLTNWELIGMQTMTIWMKSTIAAFSIIANEFPAQKIQRAAYLQQTIQMMYNGQVEQKIMDINQIKLMISCGQILYQFGKSSNQLHQKMKSDQKDKNHSEYKSSA